MAKPQIITSPSGGSGPANCGIALPVRQDHKFGRIKTPLTRKWVIE
jgi:hypothetical protein